MGSNAVTLTARTGSIQGSGAGTDINAASLTATAVTGLGSTTQLVTSGVTSGSASTSGAGAAAINIANNSASAATLSSLATVGANAPITFAQSGGGALTVTSATTTDGAITLSNAAAALTATTVTAGGSSRNITLTTTTSGTLTAGTLTATGDTITLTSAGAIIDTGAITAGLILGQAAANITLNGTVSASGGSDSLVLVAGGNFINNTGASALAPGAGRWLVYSTNPASDTRGGLVYNFKQYNATYGVTPVLGTGNGFLYSVAPSITPSLIGTVTKGYDGTTTATLAAGNYAASGAIDGDTVTLTGSGTYDTEHVGINKNVAVTGLSIASATDGAATVYGYQLASTTANANIGVITARAITVTAQTDTKGYDGTTTSVGVPLITSGTLAAGDTSGFLETFDTKHVGMGKTLTASGVVVDGNSGNNYTVSFVTNATGVITARAITVTAQTDTKGYDGGVTSVGVPLITSGMLVAGDTSGFLETFNNKNVGTGKTLTASGVVVDGNSGNNYTVSFVTNTTGVITARAITVTAQTDTKGYDGTTTSAGVPLITSGTLVAGDTSGFLETFNNKNVGTGKTLTASGVVVDGNSGNNYAVSFVTDTTGVITARAITVTAQTDTKGYDGTTTSAGVPLITSGTLAAGDTSGFLETFNNKNVGTGKTLTASGVVVDGNSGNNYAVSFVTDTTGVITVLALAVNGVVANNKVYDATTVATLTTGAASVTVLGADMVTLSSVGATGAFADPTVGVAKPVTAAGFTIGGADAGNYTLTQPVGLTADITASLVVNGMGLPGNVLYLLGGSQTGDEHLLTAGVLPDYIYRCLDQDREAVVCTAGAVWHDDDGSDSALSAEPVPGREPSAAVTKGSAPDFQAADRR